MDYPKFIVSIQNDETISLHRVKKVEPTQRRRPRLQ